HEPKPVVPPQLPVMEQARREWNPEPPTDGSLWSEASVNLFSDDKARRPGDLLLVRVDQRSIGIKEANTDTRRKSSISAKIRYFLGLEDSINRLTGYTGKAGADPGEPGWNPNNLIEATSENSYSGEGATERSDRLTATIS